jgi:amidase
VPDPAGLGTAPPVRDGVLRAGAVLADAGYDVEEVEPPDVDAAAEALLVMLSSPGVRAAWADRSAHLPVAVQQFMAAFFTVAGHPDAAAAEQAFMTRQDLLRRWGQFQVDLPLVVAPVATAIPARVGTDLSDVGGTVRSMRMVLAVSALGLPAVAVPIGVVDGLPQSVQIVGPPYREDLCLDAAAALEDRLGVLTPIEPRMQA